MRERGVAAGRRAIERVLATDLEQAAKHARQDAASEASQPVQRLLAQQWRDAAGRGERLSFADVGFSVYSQNDEDGILLYLMSVAGMTNRVAVELAFGEAYSANVTNLLVNWGWTGFLFEGFPKLAAEAAAFFAANRHTRVAPPSVITGYIDPTNVNTICEHHGLVGEADVFSLDIDGIDFWVWDALEAFSPRCVVVEFSHFWGPHASVTVPLDPAFTQERDFDETYCSASLEAYRRLGRRKGYRLVGTNNRRFNAFFLRDDVAADLIPATTPAECFANPRLPQPVDTWAAEGLPGRWVTIGEDGAPVGE